MWPPSHQSFRSRRTTSIPTWQRSTVTFHLWAWVLWRLPGLQGLILLVYSCLPPFAIRKRLWPFSNRCTCHTAASLLRHHLVQSFKLTARVKCFDQRTLYIYSGRPVTGPARRSRLGLLSFPIWSTEAALTLDGFRNVELGYAKNDFGFVTCLEQQNCPYKLF